MPTIHALVVNHPEMSSSIHGCYLSRENCEKDFEELAYDDNLNPKTSFIKEIEVNQELLDNAILATEMGLNVRFDFDINGDQEERSFSSTYFDFIRDVIAIRSAIPNSFDHSHAGILVLDYIPPFEKYGPKSHKEKTDVFIGICHWYEVYSSYLACSDISKDSVVEHMKKWKESEERCGNHAEFIIVDKKIPSIVVNQAIKCLSLGLIVDIDLGVSYYKEKHNKDMIKNVLGISAFKKYRHICNCSFNNQKNEILK